MATQKIFLWGIVSVMVIDCLASTENIVKVAPDNLYVTSSSDRSVTRKTKQMSRQRLKEEVGLACEMLLHNVCDELFVISQLAFIQDSDKICAESRAKISTLLEKRHSAMSELISFFGEGLYSTVPCSDTKMTDNAFSLQRSSLVLVGDHAIAQRSILEHIRNLLDGEAGTLFIQATRAQLQEYLVKIKHWNGESENFRRCLSDFIKEIDRLGKKNKNGHSLKEENIITE